MHKTTDSLFSALWNDYVSITPSALRIHKLLAGEENSPQIVNDHVAFRTFALDKTRLSHLAEHFLALGYEAKGDYDFKAKKSPPSTSNTRIQPCLKCLSVSYA